MQELLRYLFLVSFLVSIIFMGNCDIKDPDKEADLIREIEQERLRAIVESDMDVAHELHAEDFQLITPDGSEYTRQTYLNQIESGELDYRIWEPGEITVRLYKNVAVIRYDDSAFEVFVNGNLARSGLLCHTNLYERQNGQWKIVWSQASGGKAP
jgi:hypothetical protein